MSITGGKQTQLWYRHSEASKTKPIFGLGGGLFCQFGGQFPVQILQRQAKSGGQVFERDPDVTGERNFHGAADFVFDFGGGGAGIGEADFGFVGLLLAFLRFEPILLTGWFFALVGEFALGFVVSAFVGGLVAEVERKGFVIEFGGGQHSVLQGDGSLHEPEVLGHGIHQAAFGIVGGFVFFEEAGEEFLELFGVFPAEEAELAGEAVDDAVLGGFFAAFRGSWAGRELGVGSVGGELGFGDGATRMVLCDRFVLGGGCGGGRWGLGLLVFGFAGFALGGAADLTGRHLVSGHDLAFSEIEMARGEGWKPSREPDGK